MGILGWILFGLVVGALAALIMPGRDPRGIVVAISPGIVVALIGAIIVLGIYGLAAGRRRIA